MCKLGGMLTETCLQLHRRRAPRPAQGLLEAAPRLQEGLPEAAPLGQPMACLRLRPDWHKRTKYATEQNDCDWMRDNKRIADLTEDDGCVLMTWPCAFCAPHFGVRQRSNFINELNRTFPYEQKQTYATMTMTPTILECLATF